MYPPSMEYGTGSRRGFYAWRLAFVAGIPVFVVAACGASGGSGACTSTDTSGPCQGSFTCGNSGLEESCDKATEVCVLSPGMVICQGVTGASASQCPSASEAAAIAGCMMPFKPSCSGSSATGITVTCTQ
jgi:hypothetical protein